MDEIASPKIEYDVHEDLRFPVSFLHRSYWVLETHGFTKFRKYVDRINMPHEDIERVLNKHKYQTDPVFIESIRKKYQFIKDKWGVDIRL